MRRDNIFWGGALILFGVLFLLQAQELITNVFRLFWPILLILVGGWMVINVFWKSDSPVVQHSTSLSAKPSKCVIGFHMVPPRYESTEMHQPARR